MIVYDKNNKEINLTENPNLLVNADFRYGSINQLGKNFYNTNGIYTIDLWRLVGSTGFGGKVTVGKDNILLENTGDTNIYFVNKTDLNIESGNYHIYVNVTGLGNSTANVYCDSENGKLGVTKLKVGENFIKITGKPTTLGFELLPTTRLRINMVKLERGSYFTGMPTWDFANQVNNCLLYSIIGDMTGYLETIQPDTISFLVPISKSMRKIPNIKNNIEGMGNGISIRDITGTMKTGFNYEVSHMFKNSIRVNAIKTKHNLTRNDIGVIVFRGQSGFDANDY